MSDYQNHFCDKIVNLENSKSFLKELVQINSGTFHVEGVNQVADLLFKKFSKLADSSKKISLADYEFINDEGKKDKKPLGTALRFQKRPQAKIQIALVGHMDTVFAKDHHFQNITKLDDNTWNGPGVADLKGGLVVMYNALLYLENSPFKDEIGWDVFLNPDEEIGSPKSRDHFADIAKNKNLALIFEPSLPDGSLSRERKGVGYFSVVVKGKSAHVGREHDKGRSAILVLSEFIVEIEKLNQKYKNLTVNVGKISGGGALNVVPELATCHINVRIETLDDEKALLKELDDLSQKMNQKQDISFEYFGGITRRPKKMTKRLENLFLAYQNCAKELGFDLNWNNTGGCCDGNNFHELGLPNLDTLGVVGGNIHSDKEFVKLDSLILRAQLTGLFLLKLANKEIHI